jgi:hypothetical protein
MTKARTLSVSLPYAVARWRARRRGKNARRFVETQRLSAHPALCRDFPNQQSEASHARILNLVPWGKVKWFSHWGRAAPPGRTTAASFLPALGLDGSLEPEPLHGFD